MAFRTGDRRVAKETTHKHIGDVQESFGETRERVAEKGLKGDNDLQTHIYEKKEFPTEERV